MAIHTVIGYKEPGGSSPVENLYTGRDADKARAAVDAYQGYATRWVRNPRGLYKVNPEGAAERERAKRVAAARATKPSDEPVSARTSLEREVDRLRSENERLQSLASARQAPSAASDGPQSDDTGKGDAVESAEEGKVTPPPAAPAKKEAPKKKATSKVAGPKLS